MPRHHSTGAPASVSDSRSHQPNGDFACGPCIRTDLPLNKALRNRRLANWLWIPQPATGHSRRGSPWCCKGMTRKLCFMKHSFGIFAGLACQHTKKPHLPPSHHRRSRAIPTSKLPANSSAIDHRTKSNPHRAQKRRRRRVVSALLEAKTTQPSSVKSIRTPTVSCRAEPVPRI